MKVYNKGSEILIAKINKCDYSAKYLFNRFLFQKEFSHHNAITLSPRATALTIILRQTKRSRAHSKAKIINHPIVDLVLAADLSKRRIAIKDDVLAG